MSTRASLFCHFLHFKGCFYLNHKISFNLSVQVAIFWVFYKQFIMLFHILRSVYDHELMLDNFLITSSVNNSTYKVLSNPYPRNKNEKKALTSANASLKASEKCFLKVHGIGDSPFLMELVSYDTIKTVRSLLGNVLKSEFVRKNSLGKIK